MWRSFGKAFGRCFLRLCYFVLPYLLFIPLGSVLSGVTMLGAVFLVAAIELYLANRFLFPLIGEMVSSVFYASQVPAEEVDVQNLAQQKWREGKSAEALDVLSEYRQKNASVLRAWLMEGNLLSEMGRFTEAVDLLKEGLNAGTWNQEDRALFLYKIGHMYADQLHQPEQALPYWERAAREFPQTAYGKAAEKKLRGE